MLKAEVEAPVVSRTAALRSGPRLPVSTPTALLPSARGYGHLPYDYGHPGGGYGYGYLGGDYGYGYLGDNYSPYDAGPMYSNASQSVFRQPQAAAPVIEPPRPAHPVVTNYTWPGSAASVAPEAEAQTFGIVLKDGSTLAATTVVASGDVLHIVDPDERHMRVPMSAVNRAATMKLNRERKLTLYLPATPQ